MDESHSDKYLRLVPFFVATSGVILFILIVIFISLVNRKDVTTPVPNVSQGTNNAVPISPTPYPVPSVTFTSYEKKPGLVYPQVPAYVSTYTLKSPLTDSDALAMAQAVGVSESKKQDVGSSKITYYATSNPDTIGYLIVDKKTGAFTFQSYGVHKGDTSIDTTQDPGTYALSFVARLGVDTASVSCPITYKQKDSPFTYIECHRDFKEKGAPILGYPGILNIAEDTPLRSLTVGRASNTAEDPSITEVSLLSPRTLLPEETGKVRPNDFNTVTIALADDGRVISVESNLRLIQKITSASAQELLSPEEAYTAFTAHQSEMILTIPAGQGSVDWKKVYPGNVAQGKTATITDYLLTYVENPATIPQSSLELKYLIRGISTLDSGYTVRFVQIIPALRTSFTSVVRDSGNKILEQASAQNDSKRNVYADDPTNKVGNLGFPSNETPTVTPTTGPTNTPTPTPTRPTAPQGEGTNTPTPTIQSIPLAELCYTGSAAMVNLQRIRIDLGGGQSIEVGVSAYAPHLSHVFVLLAATDPNVSIDVARDAVFELIKKQVNIHIAREVLRLSTNTTIPNPLNLSTTAPLRNSYSEYSFTEKSDLKLIAFNRSPHVPAPYVPETTYEDFLDDVISYYNTAIFPDHLEEWATKPNLFHDWTTYSLDYSISDRGGGYEDCEYITGNSPSIFIYSQQPLKTTIQLSFPLTYTDAPYHSKTSTSTSFMVDSGPAGNLSFSGGKVTRPYLYYEYDPKSVTFNTFTKTWYVPFAQWSEKVQTIATNELGLNAKETKVLISDIQKALADDTSIQKATYLKLSLVDEKEVNTKLPINISPQPEHIYRVHMLVEGSQIPITDTRKLSSMFPLHRGSHYAVEVGARAR